MCSQDSNTRMYLNTVKKKKDLWPYSLAHWPRVLEGNGSVLLSLQTKTTGYLYYMIYNIATSVTHVHFLKLSK